MPSQDSNSFWREILMDQFAALGSVAYKLHMEMQNLYYELLPIFFMVSLVIVWIQNPTGGPDTCRSNLFVFSTTASMALWPMTRSMDRGSLTTTAS